jgi:hypothetical protein
MFPGSVFMPDGVYQTLAQLLVKGIMGHDPGSENGSQYNKNNSRGAYQKTFVSQYSLAQICGRGCLFHFLF